MLTIEEQERQAFADGNTALADALARVIDLENQACELRAIISDARDEIDPALAKLARYPIFQDHYGGGFALYDNKHFTTAEQLSAYIKQELGAGARVGVASC